MGEFEATEPVFLAEVRAVFCMNMLFCGNLKPKSQAAVTYYLAQGKNSTYSP